MQIPLISNKISKLGETIPSVNLPACITCRKMRRVRRNVMRKRDVLYSRLLKHDMKLITKYTSETLNFILHISAIISPIYHIVGFDGTPAETYLTRNTLSIW